MVQVSPGGEDLSDSGSAESARLLRLAQEGEPGAREAIVAKHLPRLLTWARGRLPPWARSVADTRDVVHEALLRTLDRLPAFRPRHRLALQAYLRQAVKNRIRDELRRLERRPILSEEALSLEAPSHAPSPLDAVLDNERAERYRRALASLTPQEQELVVARFELGYTFDQIALLAGRPSGDAARMALRRAVLKLVEELGRSDSAQAGSD